MLTPRWNSGTGRLAMAALACLSALIACSPLGGGTSDEGNTGSVGDWAWLDGDGDGIQDEEEAGLAGVIVDLLSQDGAYSDRQETDSDGNFLFESVPAGEYVLRFTPPEGYAISPQDQGEDDALDSDADPDDGLTAAFQLAGGDSSIDWDAGFSPTDGPPPPPPPPEPTLTPTPLILIPGGDYFVTGSFTNGAGDCVANPADFNVPGLLMRLGENDMQIIQAGMHENEGPMDRTDGFFDVSTGKGEGSEGYTGTLEPDGSASGTYRYTTAAGNCTWDFELTPE